ncbi:MAG: M15 family metallopeptidase [Treponema sp.]|nr:M15 family metallopeptidase [Treponema sp.]
MKRFSVFLLFSVFLFACSSSRGNSVAQGQSSSQEKSQSAMNLKTVQKQISTRAFCPDEIKEFMRFYPDIEYTVLYDMEAADWKIDMTADLYFDRTAKPKSKKTASFYWAGGRLLPKEELSKKDDYWILQYTYENKLRDPTTYTSEEIEKIKEFGSAENRKNASGTPMFFFDWLYSAHSKKTIEDHIIRTTFLGHPTRIHERIYDALKRVESKICQEALITSDNLASSSEISKISLKIDKNGHLLPLKVREIREFLVSLKSTDAFHWREIAQTSRKSFHSYGIAIDLLPKRLGGKAIFWGWEKERSGNKWMMVPIERRWIPPASVIQVFEEEGFIWGGYWVIFDNMHFEYHPELTKPLSKQSSL